MLAEVEFHTGVADPVGYAARLVRKAYRGRVRVRVVAPAPRLVELDKVLWQQPERDFVPHVRWPGTAPAVAARTPIWLCSDAAPPAHDALPKVVVNVGGSAPADAHALDRLIEIVGTDAEEAGAGRERWRAYKSAGFEIRHHPQA